MTQLQLDLRKTIIAFAGEQYMQFGIKSVSMDDLANKLGVSKKTIYQYVENKKGLVSLIIQQFIDQEKKDFESIKQKSLNALDELTDIHQYSLNILRKLSKSFMYDLNKYYRDEWKIVESYHKDYMTNVFAQNLSQGKKEGLYDPEINEQLISKLYVESSFFIVNDEIGSNTNNKEKLISDYFKYHLKAITTEKGKKHLKTN